MNKYFRGCFVIPFGFAKTFFTKLFHPIGFKGVQLAQISLFTEITISGGNLKIGKKFKMRDGAKIRVRKGGVCDIGNNVAIGSNCIVTCHDNITIGEGTELAPNVQIYDHDHDFRRSDGIKSKNYLTGKIIIGKNVWIGANTVILRGTIIGDNSIIAAGSIVKGKIEPNKVFIQKRNAIIKDV